MNGMNGSSTPEVDLYGILNISKSASKAEIKKAYHKAALANHPDKVPADQREEAEVRFKAASQAYEILSDDQKRGLYDVHGMAAFEGGAGGMPGGMDMNDILGGLFGMNMGGMGGMGGRGQRPRRSPDENQKYEVSLEDLYKGKTVKFSSTKNVICSKCTGSGAKDGVEPKTCATCKGQGVRQVLQQVGPGMVTQRLMECSACEGTGKVVNPKDKCKKCKGKRTTEEKKQLELYIPPGSQMGDKIVLKGEADQIPGADETGDIVFHIAELPHDVFDRAGADLKAALDVTLAEALTGFNRVVLKHLDGRGISLTHPQLEGKILRPGAVIKIRGEGMPMKRSGTKGDLYLTVNVQFPEDGTISDPATIDTLKKVLPGPEPPIVTEEVDEVSWEDADDEDFGEGVPGGGAAWVDEDEAAEGAQCATQ